MAEILVGVSTWLVIAWITPIGRVTTKAKAKSIPRHGCCTSVFHKKHYYGCSQTIKWETITVVLAYKPSWVYHTHLILHYPLLICSVSICLCKKETMSQSRVYDCDSLFNKGVRNEFTIKAMKAAYQPWNSATWVRVAVNLVKPDPIDNAKRGLRYNLPYFCPLNVNNWLENIGNFLSSKVLNFQ